MILAMNLEYPSQTAEYNHHRRYQYILWISMSQFAGNDPAKEGMILVGYPRTLHNRLPYVTE